MRRTELHIGLAAMITVLASGGAAAAQPAGNAPPPAVTCSASHSGVSFVCGPKDVEDLIPVPGSDWLIGGETAFSSFPGGLVAINTRTKTWRRIFPNDQTLTGDYGPDCKGAPDPKKFSAVGLGLAASSGGSMRLYTPGRILRVIEVFDLRMTSTGPEVSWNSCIPMPPGATGNAIVTLPDGRFAVSTMHEDGFTFEDMNRRINTGRVLIWTQGRGFTELPGSFSPGPNGLALGPDGASIFVAVTGAQEVMKVALDGRGVLQRIPLDFRPDNLHSAPDGSILAGGRAFEATCAGTPPAPPGNCPRVVAVVRINPTTGVVQPVVRMAYNPNFFGGSASVQVRDEMWVTAVPSAGVGYFNAK